MKLVVEITYGSEEYEGFKPIFRFIKEFKFRFTPIVPCYLKIPSNLIQSVRFIEPLFDPEKDRYIVKERSCFMLQRYYHCDRLETAKEYASKFEKEGWTIITL